ncbi:hypothetical protein AGMMS49593_05660 [Endomicrobiia bacterium]|nr:hypothetical protein AGMMS49593_05660 [Endomicrobiia bacterium]
MSELHKKSDPAVVWRLTDENNSLKAELEDLKRVQEEADWACEEVARLNEEKQKLKGGVG